MQNGSWGVAGLAVAGFAVGFIVGCSPTSPHDAVALSEAALVICGNGACESGETCASCPGDCGRCTQAHCGDGTCGRKESCATCAADCGACPGCGNGVCDVGETCTSCSADCGRCGGEFCGNGVCGRRESCTACARDCCPGTGTGGGTGGGGSACMTGGDCPATMTECVLAVCSSGSCTTALAPAGTPLTSQVTGDCQTAVCDGMGGTVVIEDNLDLPQDHNECTTDVCVSGVPNNVPVAPGTPCTNGTCDGMGTCSGCQTAQDCPGALNGCFVATCTMGVCGLAPLPAGTPSLVQAAGDCETLICDGMGNGVPQVNDMDVPVDGNECTQDLCTMGVPSNPPQGFESPCSLPDMTSGYCNGLGVCLPL